MKLVGRLAVVLVFLILLISGMSAGRSRSAWNECLGNAYDRWDVCLYNCEQYPYDSDDRPWCLHSCNSAFISEHYACENP